MKQAKKSKQITYESYDRIDAEESDYLFVSESQIPNAGKGLYTVIPISKDEVISMYKGEIISYNEAHKRAKKGNDKYFINMLDGSIMDSMHVDCFAKYANDAKGLVKARVRLNSIITIDDDNNVCLVAKRDINAGEEVFCSYGKEYWVNQKNKQIE